MIALVPSHLPSGEAQTLAGLRLPPLAADFGGGPPPLLRHEAQGNFRLKAKLAPTGGTLWLWPDPSAEAPLRLTDRAILRHSYAHPGPKQLWLEPATDSPAAVVELKLLTELANGLADLRSLPALRVFAAPRRGLVAVWLTGLTSLRTVYLGHNQLSEAQIRQLLIDLDANGASGGSFTYDGNPGAHDRLRSKEATQAYKNLLARSWRINGHRRT